MPAFDNSNIRGSNRPFSLSSNDAIEHRLALSTKGRNSLYRALRSRTGTNMVGTSSPSPQGKGEGVLFFSGAADTRFHLLCILVDRPESTHQPLGAAEKQNVYLQQ